MGSKFEWCCYNNKKVKVISVINLEIYYKIKEKMLILLFFIFQEKIINDSHKGGDIILIQDFDSQNLNVFIF